MKNSTQIFDILQRIGRSFMLPIALLPISGILLGIGASFSNEQMIKSFDLEWLLGSGTILNSILVIMKEAGNIVFANLPVIFAMGVALGMAKNEKSTATISAGIAFLVMHQSISSLLRLNCKLEPGAMLEGTITDVCGIKSLQIGVFGGLIVGLGVAYLHNKFYKINLPTIVSFFGGTRFVPIISSIAYIFVGIFMYFTWPSIQNFIYSLDTLVTHTKYLGTLIYGITERALIPFGLHHVFYMPFWQTGLGGTEIIDGQTVMGAQNIFFAQLASSVNHFSVSATRFMAGKFPFMIFGLPGAALAMYKVSRPSKKQVAGGLFLSAALTSILTGITEPLEFTFLFVAPILYVIHCIFAGISFMLMHLLNVGVGMTFSGGLIDLFLFGILQGNKKTNWINIIPVGILYFIIYYFVFKFLIEKFNFLTPGREDDSTETKLYTRKDTDLKKQNKIPKAILKGLGGAENIVSLDCCATRLRINIEDDKKIDELSLKDTGAAGVIKKGNSVQIIYGPKATLIKSDLEEYIKSINNINKN